MYSVLRIGISSGKLSLEAVVDILRGALPDDELQQLWDAGRCSIDLSSADDWAAHAQEILEQVKPIAALLMDIVDAEFDCMVDIAVYVDDVPDNSFYWEIPVPKTLMKLLVDYSVDLNFTLYGFRDGDDEGLQGAYDEWARLGKPGLQE